MNDFRVSGSILTALALLSSLSTPAASAFAWTCSTVTYKNALDPAGDRFRNRFREPDVNAAGDVVFLSRTAQRRLYSYPAAGSPEIVASEGGSATGDAIFTKFRWPSINDSGDLGFLGDLALGEGVFLRPAGGNLVAAALSGATAPPPGGIFQTFAWVSRVNASGDIAFSAVVSGGPSGIFFYDRSAATIQAIARVGDPTGDGRQLCELTTDTALDLGDSGNVAFHAFAKPTCSDGDQAARLGIWQRAGTSLTAIAEAGGTSPLAGTTYEAFFGPPLPNASGRVLFRGRLSGASRALGIFLFDPAGPSTTKLALGRDPEPASGGMLKTIAPPGGLTADNRALFRASLQRGTMRDGIFLSSDPPEPVVLGSGAAPTDVFGPGSTYRRLHEQTAVDRSGTKATFSAKVRDTVRPRSKTALFRCSRS